MNHLQDNHLYEGDSLELLKRVEPGSVRLLLTDPPYGVSRPSNFGTLGRTGCDLGEWDREFDHVSWLDLALPALGPGGNVVIWSDWKKLGTLAAALEQRGLSVKRPLVWVKKNPAPFNRERLFVQSTEFAIWAVRPHWIFHRRPGTAIEGGVFHYSSPRAPKERRHPAQKPVALFRELIEILTNPDDLVLDPFAGAGTAAVAAMQVGRRYLCIELEPKYVDLAPGEVAVVRRRDSLVPDPLPGGSPSHSLFPQFARLLHA